MYGISLEGTHLTIVAFKDATLQILATYLTNIDGIVA